jgi:hypothetical protein
MHSDGRLPRLYITPILIYPAPPLSSSVYLSVSGVRHVALRSVRPAGTSARTEGVVLFVTVHAQ